MTAPASLPEWASGGSATIVEPSGAKKALGFAAPELPSDGNMNWWMNLVYLWIQHLSVNGGLGHYDNIAALKAATGMTDNDKAQVDGFGIYRYDSASTDVADDRWIVAPTTGGGRWLNEAPGVGVIYDLLA